MPEEQLSFRSYEEQLQHLSGEAGAWTPTLTAGRRPFFADFNRWFWGSDDADHSDRYVMLPNPSYNLSLPYPRDEIAVALTAARGLAPEDGEIAAHATRYGFPAALLVRPTVALSGGEQALLSIAKAAAYAERKRHLYLVSPTFWLDNKNHIRVRQLIDEHCQRGGEVKVLLLEGESIDGYGVQSPGAAPEHLQLPWQLAVDGPEIVFPEVSFPRYTDEYRIRFVTDTKNLALVSPVLFRGPNGVGKTCFAKCLAGLLRPEMGNVMSQVAGYVDAAAGRIVFQDSILQLFGESILDHLERVFRYDSLKREEVLPLYHSFEDQLADRILADPRAGVIGPRGEPRTLLQCKLALLAERLVVGPPILILDEPSWCLSKPVARLFVELAVEEARKRKTAIILISHQHQWWSGLVGSIVEFERGEPYPTVRLRQVEVSQ